MGIFGGRSKADCDADGGHDQRMHTRTDEANGKESTVVDCGDCGMEWEYGEDGKRK